MKLSTFTDIFLFLFCGILLHANILPSPAEIQEYPLDSEEMLVYSTGFEDPKAPEIKLLSQGISFVRGAGSTGNTALKITGDKNVMARVVMEKGGVFQEGCKYQVKMLVRGKTGSTDGSSPGSYRFVSVRFRDEQSDKELPWKEYGVFPFTKFLADSDAEDDITSFHEFTFFFYGHANAYPILLFSVGEGGPYAGTVYFDDLRIYQCGRDTHLSMATPAMRAFKGGDTHYAICGICPGIAEAAVLAQLETEDGRVLSEQLLTRNAEDGLFHGELNEYPAPGKYTLRTTLVDLQGKMRLKCTAFPVSVRPKDEVPPVGAVSFNEKRQLLVDGKPFFAISLGCDQPTRDEHLRQHGSVSGFNVIDTGPFHMVNYKLENHGELLRQKLDYLQSVGLKIRLNLTDFYNRTWFCLRYGTGAEGVTNLVNAVKDHPAVLGYYLLDELTEKDWPMVTELRDAINLADPYHPCYIVTNLLSTTPKIAVTGDVLGFDYYPIRFKGGTVNNASDVDIMAQHVKATGQPFWAVPQAFNWALCQPDRTPETYQRYQKPTVNQMFADAILFALNGATDFWFYTCPMAKWSIDRATAMGDPNFAEPFFLDISQMVFSLGKLGEFFLSEIPYEEISFQNQGVSGVRIRRYRTADGKSAVVLFAEGQGVAKATFHLPEDAPWQSEFGLTTRQSDGTWLFQADGFAADVLYLN